MNKRSFLAHVLHEMLAEAIRVNEDPQRRTFRTFKLYGCNCIFIEIFKIPNSE